MTDKELIKQEIEKRLSSLWDLIPEGEKVLKNDFTKEDANYLGKYTALESILQFIDSIPEEHNKDLEEAAKKYAALKEYPCFNSPIKDFKAGANWQKQEDQESIKFVEEPDLDKAAKEHAANLYGEEWVKNEHIQDSGFKAISNFKFGAGWWKQQMMKNAVDAIVNKRDSKYFIQDTDALSNALAHYNPGDKVKIIIVKEEIMKRIR